MPLEISESISETFDDIRDNSKELSWAFFGFEGKSDKLTVVASGTSGLDGFKKFLTRPSNSDDDETSEGIKSDEIHPELAGWGVVRMSLSNDDYSVRTKFILVQCIGKNAGVIRKGKMSTQLSEIQRKLSGIHLELFPSSLEDLQERDILTELRRIGGANYDRQTSDY